jgi:hypothetical protein
MRAKTISQPKSEFVAAVQPHTQSEATDEDRELLEKMRTSLEVHDKTFLTRTFKNCFSGKEAVEWMVNNQVVATREQAFERCSMLFAAGLLVKAKIPELKRLASKGLELAQAKIQNKEIVKKPHRFKDSKTMYRFKVREACLCQSEREKKERERERERVIVLLSHTRSFSSFP